MGRSTDSASLLEVESLSVELPTDRGWVKVVDDVSFRLRRGEVLGIVGESGSGKSMTCLAVMGLLNRMGAKVTGKVMLNGDQVNSASEREMRRLRGSQLGMVFQEPMTSLNPAFTIGEQIAEQIRRHLGTSRREAKARAISLLERVGIPNAKRGVDSYPYEFSGGMRQRVMIAMALSCDPLVLFADEPTTKLDATVQAQVVALLKDLSSDTNMGIVFVSHDLGLMADVCDDIMVMYAAQVVLAGSAVDMYERPSHPYAEALLQAIPQAHSSPSEAPYIIPGSAPSDISSLGPGCRFAARCRYCEEVCRTSDPRLRPFGDGETRCVLAEQISFWGVSDR